ncbi:MAG TPA: hypothetical protein VK869_14945 [Rubrobacteraceae bacterium]|nr:hypothetical protein [Rubrobacteraceae bacterium]
MSEERSRRDINGVPVARDDRDEAQRSRATPKEPDVLLDVSELEVDKITLEVVGLRAHVSVLAQLANLVNLQVGVDARLNRVKLVIEGVRAKVLLKVWLDDVRAILEKALETLGEHPEILENLLESLNQLLEGRLGDALGALENVLEGLEEGDTVDALLRGRLEDARGALEQVLEQVGGLEGQSRGPLGEGPTDATGEPTQEEER